MRIFLIDAFNLLHQIKSIKDSGTPHEELIRFIREKRLTGSANNEVIIIFDGHEPPRCPAGGGYKIRYSNDRTADDVIKSVIEASPCKKSITVVSDDREIRSFAGISGAVVCRTKDFLSSGRTRSPINCRDDDAKATISEMIEITKEMENRWLKKANEKT